ncbi:hypothetical protein KCU62_g92, partial [Aureobasidium sp. EXF-3399]
MLFPCHLCHDLFLRLLLHLVFFCDQTRVVQVPERLSQIFEKLSRVDDHSLLPFFDGRGCMDSENPHSPDIIHLFPYKVSQSLSNKSTNHGDRFNDLARPFLAALLALEYQSLAALLYLSHFPIYKLHNFKYQTHTVGYKIQIRLRTHRKRKMRSTIQSMMEKIR